MANMISIPVAELMSRELLIVHPEDSLDRVNEIFAARNIHHIPVCDQEGGLCGILSKSDFLRVNHMLTLFNKEKYEYYNEKLYKAILVKEIMTNKVATIAPDDPLSVAVDIFRENIFHALPVVDEDGSLLGILTTQDLLYFCFTERGLLEE